MNNIEQITNIVKNISSSENDTVSFQVVSWPYSRRLIETVLKTRGINFEYKRLGKRFDEFVVDAEANVEKKIKKILRLLHAEAKILGKGAKANNDTAEHVISHLIEIEDEIKNHIADGQDFIDDEVVSTKGRKKAIKKEKVENLETENAEHSEEVEIEENVPDFEKAQTVKVKKVLRKR